MVTAAAEPSDPRRYAYGAALAAVAGAVDAVGLLHYRTFFVAFMSGDTTRVAVALAEGDGVMAVRGGAIIGCFVAGVATGDLLTGVPPRRERATLLVEAALLLAAAGAGAEPRSSLLLAAAMGMHNALVLRAEWISIALTYVTGTLVHLGRALAARIAGREPVAAWSYAGLWLALAAGAALALLAAVMVVLAAVTREQHEEDGR